MLHLLATWAYALSDDVLLTSYVPVVMVSTSVFLVYAWWAKILFSVPENERPEIRYLILGIALMFFTHGIEQGSLYLARTFNFLDSWTHNYIALSLFKIGYAVSGLLHLYGFAVSSGTHKWFWRFTFVLAIITCVTFALTANFTDVRWE